MAEQLGSEIEGANAATKDWLELTVLTSRRFTEIQKAVTRSNFYSDHMRLTPDQSAVLSGRPDDTDSEASSDEGDRWEVLSVKPVVRDAPRRTASGAAFEALEAGMSPTKATPPLPTSMRNS